MNTLPATGRKSVLDLVDPQMLSTLEKLIARWAKEQKQKMKGEAVLCHKEETLDDQIKRSGLSSMARWAQRADHGLPARAPRLGLGRKREREQVEEAHGGPTADSTNTSASSDPFPSLSSPPHPPASLAQEVADLTLSSGKKNNPTRKRKRRSEKENAPRVNVIDLTHLEAHIIDP
ncbi:hypothetical protein B484DRAFT_477900 [Ochromonadaceae sp. CCMP2298]|nr:hypothetical protein B484DRAFT_477900 [Ochromonadaceae sp. CCMP2298]